MDDKDLQYQIDKLINEINSLPKGSIAKKNIKGKDYYYLRISENGKRTEKYIDFNEVELMREKIKERKELEEKVKKLEGNIKNLKKEKKDRTEYNTYIRKGEELKRFVNSVKDLKKRECYSELYNYIYSSITDRVFILYGLRRTGKTTLIRQIISEMNDDFLNKTAFIQVSSKDTLAEVNKDLKRLEEKGYLYIFIDEVTLLEDFIEGAAVFSDIFASCGMKIVLSGTDSLGFMLSKSEQLYDRCMLLHTTFIPYREFELVLGKKGIDEYIRYGGTMSISGINYNENFVFNDKEKTNDYVNSAIARNIQHSLKYYNEGRHFRHLLELYEKNELTNVINRVVEDINHRFTKEVITKKIRSSDLSISARNLRSDKNYSNTVLDDIDRELFESRLKQLLDILDVDEQKVSVEDKHAQEIKEYLLLLDLIFEIDVLSFPVIDEKIKRMVITQPGLRYAQAEALVKSLMLDQKIINLSASERSFVISRILGEIRGRMMEDIVLLETKIAKPKKEVFKLQFSVGEFDMVVFDSDEAQCEIYEIKYSNQIVKEQYKHLIDEEKCKMTSFRFGNIKGKYVIYRGITQDVDGIHYVNVEDYLKNL